MKNGADGGLRALVVDDERLLREQLKSRLAEVWPDLAICGEARDGQEALAHEESAWSLVGRSV